MDAILIMSLLMGSSGISWAFSPSRPPISTSPNLAPPFKANNAENLLIPRGCPRDETEEEQDVIDRRRFLSSSMIGASIVLADLANAESDEHSPEKNDSEFATSMVATVDTQTILQKATKKALNGGKAGALAAVVQVCTLMWLRTAMNFQYRYGGTLGSSLKELYRDGGVPRLYQGLPFALVQGPLTRFGDTACNIGVLALLEGIPQTADLPLPLKTAAGSLSAGLWRVLLMPIDTSKTAMQVEGAEGLERLKERVFDSGPGALYQGSLAQAAATAAGHYPWFLTYNFLSDQIPIINKDDDLLLFLVRSAVLGLAASCISDCVSNSLRVIKTTKQTAGLSDDGIEEITYREALTLILEQDGVTGLLGRGLQTRLLTNAIQGAAFSILWKYFQASL
mmetsp:Transcript_31600/g.75457  ORF Transcript_31600/g.75457 Transcript_31600/m.75457 type:complete len:395 (-) Transcript_31600:193-1377(-)